jgi:hypothetical protein
MSGALVGVRIQPVILPYLGGGFGQARAVFRRFQAAESSKLFDTW